MSKNIYQSYEKGTALERAKLIFKHYCSFMAIIDDCKARLIYEIQAEEQFSRSHNRDELGVRIQKLGSHSDPTANEAIDKVALEESIEGAGNIHFSDRVSNDTQVRLQRKHHVLLIMKEEYSVFEKHLYTLMPEEQNIIIPFLMHSKGYSELAMEMGHTVEAMRKRVSRIRQMLLEDMTECFIDRI